MRDVRHGETTELPSTIADALVAENNLRVAALGEAMADAYSRKHVCGPCNAAFATIPELDRHILSHHPEDVFGDEAA